MSEVNNNINLVQLDLSSIQHQANKTESRKTKNSSESKTEAELSVATITELSNKALSQINNIISKEDSTFDSFNTKNSIYETLTNTRAQIAEILHDLKNTTKYDDITLLEELDKKSNEMISNIESLLNKEKSNLNFDFNYTSIFLNGLNSIKKLNILDDNYHINLENIMALVVEKENAYKKLTDELYSNLENINKEYNELVGPSQNKQTEKTSDFQKTIIQKYDSTLESTASKLTPDTVLRLLNQPA